MAQNGFAYDLELFQSREPKLVALKDNKKVLENKKKHQRRQAALNTITILSIAVVVLGMVAYFITCNVHLTEMNKAIADSQTQLNTLHSEQVRLQAELAGKTSAEQINNYAQQHGMLPIDNHQIYYIEGHQEDLVTLKGPAVGWFRQAWDAIWSFLS